MKMHWKEEDGQQRRDGGCKTEKEKEKSEWESNDSVNLSAEHVFSFRMEIGKCIFMIHGGHFHLWSANH